MDYNIIWFILITVLFTGFFFLEGFDYGVGALLPFISDDERERSQVVQSIGPFWDGNEVWMITAGGALFAAFPHVYATMFSTFYIALFLMLVGLIVRGVAFEFRHQRPDKNWQRAWSYGICFGSVVPAVLWGIAVANLIAGLPIAANMVYQGHFFDLLNTYSLTAGLTFLFVFCFHGAAFLTLRLAEKKLVDKARTLALRAGVIATLLFVAFMILTYSVTDLFASPFGGTALVAAAVLFLGGYAMMYKANFKPAFVLGSLAIVATTVAFFAGLFPRFMVSSLNPDWSLTIYNASSTDYTLSLMTIAAGVFVPVVLVYQCWTYYIFRKRVSADDAAHY